MPAATNRTDLLTVTQTTFAKLEAVLDGVLEAQRLLPDPGADGTTLKDIVGHRAAWIDLFLGWYEKGQTGAPVAIPAEGYKWNDIKHFNADLRVSQEAPDWDDARDLLRQNHTRLLAFIETHDDAALYGAPMKGGNNAWTAGRWAEAAGAAHYRSAAKNVRARLRTLKPG